MVSSRLGAYLLYNLSRQTLQHIYDDLSRLARRVFLEEIAVAEDIEEANQTVLCCDSACHMSPVAA
jgi:hypothetical protein